MKGTLIGSICALAAIAAVAMTFALHMRRGTVLPDERGWQNAVRLVPAKDQDGDRFSHPLALDGETALLGAPGTRVHSLATGAAYTCKLFDGEHHHETPIGASDAMPGSDFGSSVALCGNRILVGSPADNSFGEDAGAAYLYENIEGRQWERVERLVAGDAIRGDKFGTSVALGQNFALISTKRKQHLGAICCFDEGPPGTWREAGKLVPDAGTAEDWFGWPLAVHGNLAAVGACQDSSVVSRGAVYLFRRDGKKGWKQVAKLIAPSNSSAPTFGRSIALSDKTVLVGAPGYANGHAVAFLFRETNAGVWTLVAGLSPRGPGTSASFGYSVAMNGGRIAVGAPLENEAAGAVYLFQRDDQGIPRQVGKITLPDQPPGTWFGGDLALSGENLLVGAQYGRGKTQKSGAAYLFPLAAMKPIP